jgi:WD40 repeat protein
MKITVQKAHSFRGHNDCVYTLETSDTDHVFFSGAGDGMVVAWDLRKPDEGTLLAKLPNSIYALHHHCESNLLIAAQNFNGIHVLDWKNKKEVGSLRLSDTTFFDIESVDNLLFIGSGDGTLITVNLKTLQVVERIRLSEKSVRTIAINRPTAEIAVGYSDCFVRVFSLDNLQLKYEWRAHENSVFSLRYLPDHNYLISGSRDARLKVWDVKGGYTQVNEVVAHLFAINHISFSPDGRYFVTGSMDKSIKIWETEAQRLLKVIDRSRHAGHGTSVNKVLWLPHENQVISASDDRTISVWNVIFE